MVLNSLTPLALFKKKLNKTITAIKVVTYYSIYILHILLHVL